MKLVYSSGKIAEPSFNLVKHLRETILYLEVTNDTRDYIIKMGAVLYSVLDNEKVPGFPHMFKGIEYVEDNNIEDKCYCIYRKDKSIPIKLTQVKTLNDWFANLPLIHKIDHYNSHIKIIANNLK